MQKYMLNYSHRCPVARHQTNSSHRIAFPLEIGAERGKEEIYVNGQVHYQEGTRTEFEGTDDAASVQQDFR